MRIAKDLDKPAGDLTAREYAAIHLRVAASGDDDLDRMIRMAITASVQADVVARDIASGLKIEDKWKSLLTPPGPAGDRWESFEQWADGILDHMDLYDPETGEFV